MIRFALIEIFSLRAFFERFISITQLLAFVVLWYDNSTKYEEELRWHIILERIWRLI